MIRAGVNDIMIKQDDASERQMCCCGGLPAPQWIYVQPTPLLIKKGLSVNVLQQELKIINAKSADWYLSLTYFIIFTFTCLHYIQPNLLFSIQPSKRQIYQITITQHKN